MKPWREALHRQDRWHQKLQAPAVWVMVAAALACVLGFALFPALRSLQPRQHLVVYTSQDKVYAEQLFKLFSAETGIEVRAVYDSEAVKTVGIANRLLAERRRPQCDVFWNNEELRTRQLAAEGVFDEVTGWTAFGYRSRRLVINTNLISLDQVPSRFRDLTNAVWRGRFAFAYPLFGTTATHFMAWRAHDTRSDWEDWSRALAANEPMIVDGNSVVVQQVARGEVAVGMTDYDDVVAGLRESYPIAAVPLAPDAMLIPNTVGLVRGGANPQAGRRFMQWLTRPETLHRLVALGAIEGIEPGRDAEPVLRPDWSAMLRDLEPATAELQARFLR